MIFNDITLIGVDSERSVPPVSSGRMSRVVLGFSSAAPESWCNEFNTLWREQIYSTKRHATASRYEVEITCLLEELERDRLPYMRAVMQQVNDSYRSRYAASKAHQSTIKDHAHEMEEINRRLFTSSLTA